jgi:Zn-dependent protease
MSFLPILFFFIIIIPSAIIHEYMHGWVADQLGDPTARYAGRLTLNPKSHIDPMGTIVMPLVLFFISGGSFMFAYAKPVPYNPFNLRGGKWSPAYVAIAGPLANFVLAYVFGLIIQFAPISASLASILSIIVYANVLLGVFNLVPIPPLDGSKVLFALLPDSAWKVRQVLEKYGFMILIIFIFFFFNLISPIIRSLYLFFTGGVGLF